ncbi:hypothetical protein KEM56_001888, partial [Ascosphaera pollenicola]
MGPYRVCAPGQATPGQRVRQAQQAAAAPYPEVQPPRAREEDLWSMLKAQQQAYAVQMQPFLAEGQHNPAMWTAWAAAFPGPAPLSGPTLAPSFGTASAADYAFATAPAVADPLAAYAAAPAPAPAPLLAPAPAPTPAAFAPAPAAAATAAAATAAAPAPAPAPLLGPAAAAPVQTPAVAFDAAAAPPYLGEASAVAQSSAPASNA